jgi:nickel transport protein
MRRTIYLSLLLTAFVLTLGALDTYAHDLVLIPTGPDGLILELGHPAEYSVPDADRLIQLNVWMTGNDKPVSALSGITKSFTDHTVLDLRGFSAGRSVAIVSGQYDNGYWVTLSGERHLNTSKLHMRGAIDSGTFFKFGKALFPSVSVNGGYDRKLGELLEIVPTSDPFKARPGQKLPVEVLYMNKPLPGVGVEIGDGRTKMKEEDIPRFKTDARGIALVPISKPGLQIMAVDYRTPPRSPQLSDHDDYSACLVFKIGTDARQY